MSVLGLTPNVGRVKRFTAPLAEITMHETATGYVVRRSSRAGARLQLARIAAIGGGLVLAVLALALAVAAYRHAGPLGWGAAVIFAAAAALLIEYGWQLQERAFEVDLAAQELREMSQGSDGTLKCRARYPFSSISGLFIDESRAEPTLVLRISGAERVLPVATGERSELGPLATRIGRDLRDGPPARLPVLRRA